jgi:dihydrofolate reductase
MRKLKLQMQMSIDGFVGGPSGELDWMTWNLDPEIEAFIVNELTDTSDTILLGRKMTEGFVKHWEQQAAQGSGKERDFGVRMVNMPKVVFSRTVTQVAGKNLRVENGPLVDAVNDLKRQRGRDIIVYGGAAFVSSLIEHDLIDELNLFVNPTAIGAGLRIFGARRSLELIASRAFPCGIVVNTYRRPVVTP